MSKHEKIVAFLHAHVGEHEQPMGSNTGTFVRYCQDATWLKGTTRWPWCVATWVRAAVDAGFKLPYLGAGAYEMLRWYQRNAPLWVVPIEKAKPGAALIWNIGAGHLSTLVEPYENTKPYVHTIGGNESDAVRDGRRHVSLLLGVVDPPETSKHPPTPAKPPVYEVVTSESGHTKIVYVSGQKAISRKLRQLLNRYGGITIRRRKNK